MALGPEDILHLNVAEDRRLMFWRFVDRKRADECWPWRGSLAQSGYGQCKWPERGSRKKERAHRVAFLIANGWLPLGRGGGRGVVRHKCDNRACCNPSHLEHGTQADNVRDAIKRNRAKNPPVLSRDSHPRARLTAEAVERAREARRAGEPSAALARRFGVAETTMAHALAGRTWRQP